ncbi:MAG: phosphoenolpyruvate carboxykinase (GTP) [Candidatus Omnitrophica bacterium]|nr:phosphoenolpyruvate carboxykinase (GTP) [Candidatus Omnitrophota bacterium]MBD3269797.1 phosphoenolpyruvate carboxykinase (GTP) [Candidatus Omnitrophota bacterium]
MNYRDFLKERLNEDNFNKLDRLDSRDVFNFVGKYVDICNPESVFVRTDSSGDIAYIKDKAVALGEEKKLNTTGHTVHFDGYFDQARDKKNTKYLLPEGEKISYYVNTTDKQQGSREILDILKNIMSGKEMYVCFFCLGPLDSDFSILAVQITDSAYVAHSEDILYRSGYEAFKKNKSNTGFFKFVHSAGELENCISKRVDKRRVYIDLEKNLVYSVNTQYAGNTVGLKKLALRLAIKKASREGWLAEHMFVMSVSDQSGSKAYFCGAYPSMCGKTSTAMLPGETVIGDDIAYLRCRKDGIYAVNVERGIFGIIKDVNAKDDPILFKALNTEGEVIFSNVLVDKKGIPFWIGKGGKCCEEGVNFSGKWFPGKTDSQGEEIPLSHKNARYTIRLRDLENVDEDLENPRGVKIKGLIYGGRDADTSPPVEQALNWQQGIITKGASLESETTAATLGQEGVRVFNPMSNIDFLSIKLGTYIKMNLDFGKKIEDTDMIFSVNYFLRDKQGKFLNEIQDKIIWLKWIRLRAEKRIDALLTPTGFIPLYEDLKILFQGVLKKDYPKGDYTEQFTLRIPENLAKIERIKNIYRDLIDIPDCLFSELDSQQQRLKECRKVHGDYVNPDKFNTR